MPSIKNIVSLDSVSKHYPQGPEIIYAVNNVSLRISEGDFVTITGRSGAGKTTLLSLIGGLTSPTSGRLNIFNHDLATLADAEISFLRAKYIGFVFQFASLIPTLTALDNVRLPGLFAKKPISPFEAKELLALVGLSDKIHNFPAELSGGQQARVALARALANHPRLLLADEPTGNLDVETEEEVLGFIRELNQKQKITVLLVTHNPKLASYGNRHLIMQSGKITETDHGKNLHGLG